ncbi:MAG: hypothetical protein IPK60_19670 [Sandaracinaceae bacterium]|nr:hypothetical protein [Sandaracinaceae bacterium]
MPKANDRRAGELCEIALVTPKIAAELVRVGDQIDSAMSENEPLIDGYERLYAQLGLQRDAISSAFREGRFTRIDITIMQHLEQLDAALVHRIGIYFLNEHGAVISGSEPNWRQRIKHLLGSRPISTRDVFIAIAENVLLGQLGSSGIPDATARRWDILVEALPILGFKDADGDARLLSQHASGVRKALLELEPRFPEVMGIARGWDPSSIVGPAGDFHVALPQDVSRLLQLEHSKQSPQMSPPAHVTPRGSDDVSSRGADAGRNAAREPRDGGGGGGGEAGGGSNKP